MDKLLRKPIVMGNWKLHGNSEMLLSWCTAFVGQALPLDEMDIAIFPPALLAYLAIQQLAGTQISVGVQDISSQSFGAYTGEISAQMAIDIGCDYALIGHSERRQWHGETDALVCEKLKQALEAAIRPVLCVGESLEERESGLAFAVLERQLKGALKGVEFTELDSLIIAYEPVWAIGTGKTASPEQAEEVHAFIRHLLEKMSETLAKNVRIVYGGSVKSGNAKALFSMPNIDGGLVGSASLDPAEFAKICQAVE